MRAVGGAVGARAGGGGMGPHVLSLISLILSLTPGRVSSAASAGPERTTQKRPRKDDYEPIEEDMNDVRRVIDAYIRSCTGQFLASPLGCTHVPPSTFGIMTFSTERQHGAACLL